MNKIYLLQPVVHATGLLLLVHGALMLLPTIADLSAGSREWQAFLSGSMVTVFVGALLAIASRGRYGTFSPWQGFVLTVLAWLAVVGFGALPFVFAKTGLSFTDAFFESMSGFTTTGSTVIVGLDHYPPGLLFWRSLSQWLGGLGIVLMAMLMLPFLRSGGMQLFRMESSDKSDKLVPRAMEFVQRVGIVYTALTLLCALFLRLAGMSWFDAINHAMTTLATGGFSTKDASVGYYDNAAIDWILVVFMLSGALPLIWYARVAAGGWRVAVADSQVRHFLGVAVVAVGAMTLWVWLSVGEPPLRALRLAAFNVVSVLTDTGFANADFGSWGSFAVGGFFGLYFIGGCAGSTAGAVKMFRWHILAMSIRQQFIRLLYPHRVVVMQYDRRPVSEELLTTVVNFFFLYVVSFAVLSLALMLCGLDFLSAVSGIAQAMANAGLGLGPVIGPSSNFAGLPDSAKWILSFAMLAGRLELFTLYVVLLPSFWTRD